MIEWSQPNAAQPCQEVVAEPVTSCQVVRLYRLRINIHFAVQKERNVYQMFKRFGAFLFCIINKNVSYSNNKMLFKIIFKIAQYGLLGCPQKSPSIVLKFGELASSSFRNYTGPRSSWITHPPEVLLRVHVVFNWQWLLHLPSVFMPLDHSPFWSKICHFAWTKLQFKCLVLGLAVGIFQGHSLSAFLI